MKVVHVPYCFYPEAVGGTEIYVESVAREMAQAGVEIMIAAPGPRDTTYQHEDLLVRRFAVAPEVGDLRELYGVGDPVAADAFGRLLDDEQPDVVHLHALTRGVSLLLVRETKRRGIPVVFTYHTPTVSCQRGTLLRWGNEMCDGVLDVSRCAGCTLHGLGVGRPASMLLGRLPPPLGRIAGRAGLSGGAWTAVRMTELIELRHDAFRAVMAEVDSVVVLCEWTAGLLRNNGVKTQSITISRHGLPRPKPDTAETTWGIPQGDSRPLRIAFLGRLHPIKGPDLLIRALRRLPEAPAELHLYGIVQDPAAAAYLRHLQRIAGADPRIVFLEPVRNQEIGALLRRYHVLAVPSRWLETGPLVVLEAFGAGVPVVGSDLGGISELVCNGVNGLLVKSPTDRDWERILRRLLEEPALLSRLQSGVLPPRTMTEVAAELLTVYEVARNRSARSWQGPVAVTGSDASD